MRTGTRFLIMILALVLAGAAGWLYYQATLTDTAYMVKDGLPQYSQITDLEKQAVAVTVPRQREFTVLKANEILGQYTAHPVTSGQMLQPGMLIEAPPDGRRRFENGLLPENTRAYPVDLGTVSAIFKPDDVIDILLLLNQDGQPSEEDQAILLFQKIRVLEGGGGQGQAWVALTYDQIAALEGWKQVPGVAFTGALSQPINGDFPGLYTVPLYPDYEDEAVQDLFAVPTPTPAPAPDDAEGE